MLYIAVFDIINKKGFHMKKKESVSKQLREKIKRLKKEELAYAALPGALPLGAAPVAGMAMGNRSGHKTAGFFLGPSGVLGAEDKNTGKNHAAEAIIGPALGAGIVGGLAGVKNSAGSPLSRARLASIMATGGLLGGAAGGTFSYYMGKGLGKKYSKNEAALEDINPKYISKK